jgi:hypothetical protein
MHTLFKTSRATGGSLRLLLLFCGLCGRSAGSTALDAMLPCAVRPSIQSTFCAGLFCVCNLRLSVSCREVIPHLARLADMHASPRCVLLGRPTARLVEAAPPRFVLRRPVPAHVHHFWNVSPCSSVAIAWVCCGSIPQCAVCCRVVRVACHCLCCYAARPPTILGLSARRFKIYHW